LVGGAAAATVAALAVVEGGDFTGHTLKATGLNIASGGFIVADDGVGIGGEFTGSLITHEYLSVGGGYTGGGSGATISAAGVGQFNGALTTDGALTANSAAITGALSAASQILTGSMTADSFIIGGGFGDSGITGTNAGELSCDGAFKSLSASIGGGYTVGGSGAGITSAGAGNYNGSLTTDNSIIADNAIIGGGYGSAGTTISNAGVIQTDGAFTTGGTLTALDAAFGGGYGTTGTTITNAGVINTDGVITSGATGTNGGLVIKSTGAGAQTLGIAGATGIVTLAGSGTIDNNTDTGIINFTETLTKATGNFETTGSMTSLSALVGGGYTAGTAGSGATVSSAGVGQFNGALNTDSTLTSGVNGATGIVGGLTVNNGANPGAASLSVAGATGIVTMDGGATLDNNASATVLNITEATVRVTGTLDVTTSATADNIVCTNAATFGGGYTAGTAGTGATITTAGVGQFDGALNTDSTLTSGINGATGVVGGLTINNGANPGATSFAVAGATGIVTLGGGTTIDNNADAAICNITEGTVKVTGALTTTAAATADNIVCTNAATFGGGYTAGTAGSGATISTAGVGQFNGAFNTDSTITSGVNGATGIVGGLTINNGLNPGAASLSVAGATGIMTLAGGALVDNNTDTAVLNLTETTVKATGNLETTGSITAATTAQIDGIITSGKTGSDGGLVIKETTAGATKYSIAGATGIQTLAGAATVDNNTDTGVLNFTETLVKATGNFETTGSATADTAVIGGGYAGGSGATIATDGALSTNSTIQADGVITSGKVGSNGGLAIKSTGAGATTFGVAGATGIVTMSGGGLIDNDTNNTIINLTENTIKATGNFETTGTGTFGGNVVLQSAETIDNSTDGIVNITATTTKATGNLETTGSITAATTAQIDGVITSGKTGSNGGLVIKETAAGVTKLSVAGATGIATLAGAATIDNNTDTGILNFTETLVKATGNFETTGSTTTDTLVVGGGYASSGLSVATDGALTSASTALFDSTITSGKTGSNGGLEIKSTGAGATTFGVAGATGIATFVNGATIDNNADAAVLNITEGTVKATGNLATTGSLTIDDVVMTAPQIVLNERQRVPLAGGAGVGLNAAAVEILPALTGKKYRVVDAKFIAYGGALAATADATGIKLTGTQSAGAVALVSILNAALTQSTSVELNSANVTVLADGAGLMACDAATAVNLDVITAGARDLITATGIDVIISYVVEE
jgi:hypothetical protein